MTAENTQLRSINLLGSPLHLGSRQELLNLARRSLAQSDRSLHFMALNPIKVIRAQREPELQEYLRKADLVYADASGISLAAKLLFGVSQPRVPGYELHLDILQICQNLGFGVYVLGGRNEVLGSALTEYQQAFPRLNIVGSHHGYFSEEDFDSTILPQVVALQPNLVLVAMGARVQEYWIERIRATSQVPLLLGIGGSLDALVGATPRAPRVMLNLGLEWLYRLIRQPRRWRVMLALPIFAMQTLQSRLRLRGL